MGGPSTHRRQIAAAIKEKSDDGRHPQVVAKGHGTIAEQILALAFASGVKVREDADLIEILEAMEVDCEIPVFALATVAEILSYVYRANGQSPTQPNVGPSGTHMRSGE